MTRMERAQIGRGRGVLGDCQPRTLRIARMLLDLVTSLRFASGRLSARALRCSGWLLSGRGGVPKVPTPDTPPSPFRTFWPRMPTDVLGPPLLYARRRGASRRPSGVRAVCIDVSKRRCLEGGGEPGGEAWSPERERARISPGDGSTGRGIAISGALKATFTAWRGTAVSG
jgi:hypothetical protein